MKGVPFMFEWIAANLPTILICLTLLVLAGLAGRRLYKNRKKGGCGCGCSECPHAGSCHKPE